MAFMHDGFSTIISVWTNGQPINLKEREVQPPDLDGGGEIDTTTMRNVRWRTKAPKSLWTLGDLTVQVQYDPIAYQQLLPWVNVITYFTVVFPTGQWIGFYGWIDKFTPPSHKEGEFPVAELKVHCSNTDANGNEWAPHYEDAPGGWGAEDNPFESAGAGGHSAGFGGGGGGGEGGSGGLSSSAPNMVGD